ncbi:MAG TPA: type IV pilus biogenesis/stability protein PilW [Gammaproteobacteria bacterium]|nr:type IV pilus biogenesis/stability protein PilW [Gammaproteobacteria bacterium]
MRLLLTLCIALLLSACVTERVGDPTLEEGKKSDKQQALIRAQLAANYLQREELKVALDEVTTALELDPSNTSANYIMALLQVRFKDRDKVDYYFRKAIDGPDPLPNAQQDYANYLCREGEYKKAEKEFTALHKNPIYPNQDLVYLNEAECFIRANDFEKSEKALRSALKINPRLVPALYHMTVLSFQSGNMLRTRAWYQRYLEIGPDKPRILYIAYQTETTLGDKDTASSMAVRLKGKFPDSEQAQLLRGNR